MNRYIRVLIVVGALTACDAPLDEQVYSEFEPGSFLSTSSGMESMLAGAYAELQINGFTWREMHITFPEVTTDILTLTGGALERDARPFMDFTWDASHPFFENHWSRYYRAIRNSNVILDNLEIVSLSEELSRLFEAEARFVRAKAYFELYNLFGPVPLLTTNELEDLEQPRASDEEMRQFIESELRASAEELPLVHSDYGRGTKGAALGYLTQFLLDTRQWQKAADAAQEVMNLGAYALVEDRYAMFDVANERNTEFIFVSPALPIAGEGNAYLPHAIPAGYVYKYPPKEDFGVEFRTPWWFVESFHPDDERKEHLLTEFVNSEGESISLAPNYALSHKYHEDPDSHDRWAGNDVVELRYAAILLARAEALNELQGPNQESIDLVNEIRRVAGVPPLVPSAYASTEALREQILIERAWEFYTEGKRRQDLIRHSLFIQNAQARGKPAQPHHVLFPIPQSEVDANRNLEQNPGY